MLIFFVFQTWIIATGTSTWCLFLVSSENMNLNPIKKTPVTFYDFLIWAAVVLNNMNVSGTDQVTDFPQIRYAIFFNCFGISFFYFL